MFYVDRRANIINLKNYQPFSLNRLPTPVAGFEKVNKRSVIPDPKLRISNDEYTLRSVVCVKTNDTLGKKNLVIGSMAIVRSVNRRHTLCYDPYSPQDAGGSRYPVKRITDTSTFNNYVQKQG